MILKVIPQSEIFKLREKHKDTLIEEYNKEREFLSKVICPRCKTKLASKVNIDNPFSDYKLLPNVLMYCNSCGIELEPYTGIVTKSGTGTDIIKSI